MLRANNIDHALSIALNPDTLIIEDESHRHNVPVGAETHFKIIAVSAQFNELTRVARHRLVNTLLQSEFKTGLHALSLFLYTPNEWQDKKPAIPSSPVCRNGKHRD